MPITDMLIDAAANKGILTFMDRYLGYHQIYLTEEYIHKIVFVAQDPLRFLNGLLCHSDWRIQAQPIKGQ